jgi:DNA-binding NarL/FixJ family response regulator
VQVQVIVVDPHPISRSGLHALLDQQAEIVVQGSSPDERGLTDLLQAGDDPVIILQHQLPILDSCAVVRRLTDLSEPPGVLVLTADPADPGPGAALAAGARGYLTQEAPVPLLLAAVYAVAVGAVVLDPAAAPALVRSSVPPTGTDSRLRLLSPQERQVLSMLAAGLSNAEIAARLTVAHSTVKKHVSAVLRKLALRDRQQALLFAHQAGVRPAEPRVAVAGRLKTARPGPVRIGPRAVAPGAAVDSPKVDSGRM